MGWARARRGGHWWFAGGLDTTEGLHHAAPDGRWRLVVAGESSLADGHWATVGDALFRLVDDEAVPRFQAREIGANGRLRILDSEGPAGVWVADEDQRVFWVPGTGEPERYGPPTFATTVRDAFRLDGEVWLATYGAGLVSGTDPTLQVGMVQGLCDDAVSRVLPVGDALWLNTNRGSARIQREQLAAFQRGERQDILCELVGTAEGNGRTGVHHEGRLYLPTIEGTVRVDPRHALTAAQAPLLHLESARCGVWDLLQEHRAEGSCHLSAEVTALSFDDPHGVRFRYRFDGDTWSELSQGRRIRVLAVEPGVHELEVQARSARGVWSETAVVRFRRDPSLLESWQVRYGLPFFVLVFALWRWVALAERTRRLEQEIARRKRAEEELILQQEARAKTEADLAASRKQEALGRLARGVVHDFNNLLTVVLGAMDRLAEIPEAMEEVRLVEQASEQAFGLIRQLGQLGKSVPRRPTLTDPAPILRRLPRVLKGMIGRTLLTVEAEDGLQIRVDPTRLERLVTNLVLNAHQAGATFIQVRFRDDAPEHVVLQVADDGRGIGPDQIDRVFEPYFSGRAGGTGLGLAIVRSVVEEGGGTIEVATRPGVGTTFTARFPCAGRDVPQGAA